MSTKKMVNPRNAYGEALVELGKKFKNLLLFYAHGSLIRIRCLPLKELPMHKFIFMPKRTLVVFLPHPYLPLSTQWKGGWGRGLSSVNFYLCFKLIKGIIALLFFDTS